MRLGCYFNFPAPYPPGSGAPAPSGSGPTSEEDPEYEAVAPTASCHFKRFVIPSKTLIHTQLPERDDEFFEGDALSVSRPRLGYPSVLFTGAYPNAVELLTADAQQMLQSKEARAVGLPDPEPVRLIAPGHTDTKSGLSAMQEMEKAGNSAVHYLAPLPPGLHAESPELFGFFTYEFRVGHKKGWTTAQGRFGRPLKMRGVQHPAPQLYSIPTRNERYLTVFATYAQSVFNGRNITPKPPRTQIWALLYAQVRMADNSDNRNILLDDRRLTPVRGRRMESLRAAHAAVARSNSDAAQTGLTRWTNKDIHSLLRQYGLPEDSPLSVLCVEVLPGYDQFAIRREGRGANREYAASRQPIGAEAIAMQQLRQIEEQEPMEYQGFARAYNPDRPLSDDLGYFRILRTSPLTAVPPICCTEDCKST